MILSHNSVMYVISGEANAHEMATTSKTINKKVKRALSLPNLRGISSLLIEGCPDVVNSPKHVVKSKRTEEPNFSLLRSNILYLMFFVGSFNCLGGDVVMQWAKNGYINNNTKLFLSFFVANVLLWIDFNFQVFRKSNSCFRSCNFCEELFQDSTNTMLCILIAPFILITKGIRLDHK